MLSNAYFLAKFRFETAENEPAKNLQNLPILLTLTPRADLHSQDVRRRVARRRRRRRRSGRPRPADAERRLRGLVLLRQEREAIWVGRHI